MGMFKAHAAGLIGVTFVALQPACAQSTAAPDLSGLALDESALALHLDYSQEPSLMSNRSSADIDPFAEGTWIWNIYGGGGFGHDTGELYSAHFGAGYHIIDNFSINVDGTIAFNDDHEQDDAVGGGFDVLLRWHFWRDEEWSLFLDGGAGMIVFEDDFPKHGTHFNFTPQLGLGFTYQLSEECFMMGGVKWLHISNADIRGEKHNPSYDAALVFLGVMLPF